MLGRLILILLQLGLGWVAGQALVKYIPIPGNLRLVALIIAFAVVVWIIGLVAAQILRDVATPVGATLVAALIGAAVLAALPYIPVVEDYVRRVGIASAYLPLLGAVLGYQLRSK